MSIFRRIYTIAKAEVNSRLRPNAENVSTRTAGDSDDAEGSSSKSRRWHESENQQHGNNHKKSNDSSANPHIAEWYAVLEIPVGSDLETAQKAWKKLLRQYHPDKHASDPEKAKVAHGVSQQLNQAYDGLKKHLKT